MELRPPGPRRVAAAVLLVWLAGCAHAPSATFPGGAVAQVNVVPPFLEAWEAVRSAPRAEQLERTRETLRSTHPELFGTEVFGTADALEANLERLLVELPRLDPKLRALSERMPGEIDRSARRFSQEFPELRWSGPAALSLSFSQFEAVWRTLSGKRTLVLGLDTIAFYRGPYTPVDPLIHHALASALLPSWAGPGPAPLWWTVWDEGFPLVVVRTLDPGVSDADLRLPTEGQDPADVAALARRVRAALDSTRQGDRRLVTGPGQWLSLRVAEAVVAGRSLHEAARLGGAQLRAAVDAALGRLDRPGS